jgi:predicted dehydrogenase
MYRHHPAVARIDELLAAGALGTLDSIHAAFSIFDPEESPPDDDARDWRQRVELGGGAPYDIACYCVDACNRFAGARPLRAQAVTSASERYGTVARVFGLVEYANGVVGTIESSMRADLNHELRLNGTLGHARLPVAWRIDFPTEVVASRSVGWGLVEEERFPAPAVDAYRLELEAFAAAARGLAEPAPTLAESVVTAFTVDALLASGRDGGAVDVEVPEAVLA